MQPAIRLAKGETVSSSRLMIAHSSDRKIVKVRMAKIASPTAFISYSWDDEEHKDWVREFAERLVQNGISVTLDTWEVHPGQSVSQFMEKSVTDSEFTIIICTPNYAQKSIERKGGVGYEQQIISAKIFGGHDRRKFIPIVRSGSFDDGERCAIPAHFKGTFALDFRPENKKDAFEDLIRALYDRPKYVRPELGKEPEFRLGPSDFFGRNIRLPTSELDGYQIISGIASSETFPDTFIIPDHDSIAQISEGDFVKLSFMISLTKKINDAQGERMWVEVAEIRGPYLIGTLASEPIDALENNNSPLNYGSKVVFLPEHICDVALKSDVDEREKASQRVLSELDKEGATFWVIVSSDAVIRAELMASGFPLEDLIEKFGLDLEVLHSTKVIESEEMKNTIAQIRERLRTGNFKLA